ncbi:MAG: hypothetical protein ABFS09_04775 [Thermodesulfobacteriota bacterium]
MSKSIPHKERQPACLLILGIDASGKNHVANVISDHLAAGGRMVEKRQGSFSAPASAATSSEDKGFLNLAKEALFLKAYPLLKPLIFPVINLLLNRDLQAFRQSRGALLVISNTALRVLAFHLGHVFSRPEEIRLPAYLATTLGAIQPRTQVASLVLDVDHHVREARVGHRLANNKADHFDQYLAGDGLLSERIEEFLVWLATTYLGARVLINNNLRDEEIIAFMQEVVAPGEALP